MTANKAWDYMLETNLVSEETLQVVTNINGYSLETLEEVLYAVTGYKDFDQYLDEGGAWS